jgi:hypothetical protein
MLGMTMTIVSVSFFCSIYFCFIFLYIYWSSISPRGSILVVILRNLGNRLGEKYFQVLFSQLTVLEDLTTSLKSTTFLKLKLSLAYMPGCSCSDRIDYVAGVGVDLSAWSKNVQRAIK